MTDLSDFQHPRFAWMYEKINAEAERRGTAEHRDRTLAGLSGRVLEIGAKTRHFAAKHSGVAHRRPACGRDGRGLRRHPRHRDGRRATVRDVSADHTDST